MKKRLVMGLVVLATVVGLAFAEGYSYTKVYECGHREVAQTNDKNKAGREILMSVSCMACRYAEKRKGVCDDKQATQENKNTYKCSPWDRIYN